MIQFLKQVIKGVRCGAEGLQLSHIGDGSRIFNNVFFMASTDWKDPFQRYQEGHLQVVMRTGEVVIENNIFIGAVDSMISPRIIKSDADPVAPGSLTIQNNYFSHSRGTIFSYIHNKNNTATALNFVNNFFGEVISQRDEVENASGAEDFFFQTRFNVSNPINFDGNIFGGTRRGYSTIGNGLNGVQANVTATNNSYGIPPQLIFVDNGISQESDYRTFEVWSDCSTVYANRPISYQVGDTVRHGTKFYRLTKALNTAYNCSYNYWAACVVDSSTPSGYASVNYSIGTIIDTKDERLYRLTSAHESYDCSAASQIFQNSSPDEDSGWIQEFINIVPGTAAGNEFWQELAIPNDDLRLSPASEFKRAGLLDILK